MPITEIVIYTIKPNAIKQYSSIISEIQEIISKIDGFIRFETFVSCEKSNVFMDIVKWKTLEEAKAAAKYIKEIQKQEVLSPYLKSFENVDVFLYFQPFTAQN